MRTFFLPIAVFASIGIAFPSEVKAFDVNCDSPVWSDSEECQEKTPLRIKTDINIKGKIKGRFVFNELFPANQPPNTQIFYDREYIGTGCNIFGKCLRTGGVIAKWSNYFVELRPYEDSTTFRTIGGSRNFTTPPDSIWFKTSGDSIQIRMTNRDKNQYYLPLKLRKLIAKDSSDLSIEMSGTELPVYKVGAKARPLLNQIINTQKELKDALRASSGKASKADRLAEIKDLLDQGLINRGEYNDARKKIISE